MALFLSSFTNKLDPKGRLSVPSAFRTALGAESFAGVVLFRSFTGRCIEGLPMSRMERIADATDQMDMFDAKLDELTAMMFADARQLAFDVTGRIVVPKDLLDHAGITTEAVFVGRGRGFQIWEPSAFEKMQSESLLKLQKQKPTLTLR
ncbi:MAG: division/cell wall cluster transcriptional repressor MraZ [Rickettsiales bacterium]|nr:division/cell wall cluster transcriptional repressor MraZ [Rickettsiales bacterium]